jgi:protein TonB
MNRPLINSRLAETDLDSAAKNGVAAKVIPLRPVLNESNGGFLPVAAGALGLWHFKEGVEQSDKHVLDYLILGTIVALLHVAVVNHFQHANFDQEPVQKPPKVEINLIKPQPKPIVEPPPPPPPPPKVVEPPKPPVAKATPPKPKPVVPKPKPVVAKAVPLKPQPKTKVKAEVVDRVPTPVPVQDNTPVVAKAPPSPPAPPAPKPAVVEKVTQPSAGASYLHNPRPAYPEAAMERGLEGKVLMKVHVQPNGKPDSVTVSKSSGHSILDAAAVSTVKQWSFVPAMRGKTPIAGWVTVPLTFNLQN